MLSLLLASIVLPVESLLERLQVHVFGESGPLHPTQECEQGGGAVCVGQQVLDIELWLAEVLREPLNCHHLQQYFLSDYALHVSGVSGYHHSHTLMTAPSTSTIYHTHLLDLSPYGDNQPCLACLGVIVDKWENSWVSLKQSISHMTVT